MDKYNFKLIKRFSRHDSDKNKILITFDLINLRKDHSGYYGFNYNNKFYELSGYYPEFVLNLDGRKLSEALFDLHKSNDCILSVEYYVTKKRFYILNNKRVQLYINNWNIINRLKEFTLFKIKYWLYDNNCGHFIRKDISIDITIINFDISLYTYIIKRKNL